MKQSRITRLLALMLAIAITMSLVGCGSNPPPSNSGETTPSSGQESVATEHTTAPSVNPTKPTEETTPEDTTATEPVIAPTEPETDENGLTDQQRNSFSMLYYLAITAEDIRISKDNRLLLDDIYTSLLNDINPGAIDDETQDHLTQLRDIIKSYISISVKRDRLQYMYNQEKAAAIRSAVPDPLAILSVTNSLDWKKLATSVVFTVVDSYTNYKTASQSADQAFLMSGWELDDEETATIQRNRERAFDYMVDIVQKYALDGKLTLNEQAIQTFAEICEIESVQQKIRRLESEEATYKLLGNYWLELADCYFATSQYQKCLDCVAKYNELSTEIYRKDYNYVQILPKAIVAAQAVYEGDAYISCIGTFADAIIENTVTTEWSVRYFAAQVYLDLYSKTNNRTYLEKAYNIAYDNMTILIDEQRAMNATYLAAVQEVSVEEPDYRFMNEQQKKDAEKEYEAEKKRVKEYNKALHNNRKTELPSVYEPLVLNCELLFALADEMNISDTEKKEIEAILQTENNGIFLVAPINNRYSFSKPTESYTITFGKTSIVIPVVLLSADAKVTVTVVDNGESVTFDDCVVTKVERQQDSIESYFAHISSEKMEKYSWTADSKVTLEITNDTAYDPICFSFKVAEYSGNWIFPDKVVFEQE